ncbi:MAG: enoyl-CoA hydratase/isomerase family protein [Desulfarculus sp.]|jgi:enoyl-CoA hydratase/carnithine racemase|nr:MAG: enoyl-CoA hydratase/isomerase family protein [Desulfarculus sp.]
MEFANIKFEEIDKVARVTLNRPEVRNALNPALLTEMIQVVEYLLQSKKIKALIITGTQNVFSGGGDLDMLEGDLCQKSSPEIYEVLKAYYGKAALALRTLPFPVIAAINGPAVGAAFDLCLNCDIRLAARSAILGSIWVRICTIPALGGMYLLPRIVGYGRAAEMIFTGDTISAEEAYRIGLVNHVYDDDKLAEEALRLASRLAGGATGAIAIAKNGLNRGLDGTFAGEVDYAVYMQSLCLKMDDCAEGIKAFKERRKPNFTGK